MYISSCLSNIHNANALVSKINHRLFTLKKVTKFADMRTSKMIANSIILSVFKYSCPLMINSDIIIINKISSLLLKCSRPLLGFISYKWNTSTIMKKLGWVTYSQMITIESVNFIHKCIFDDTPRTINELITFSLNRENNVRSIRKPILKENVNSLRGNQSLIPRAIFLYNSLPDIFRTYNYKKFKKCSKKYIMENFQINCIPKNENK